MSTLLLLGTQLEMLRPLQCQVLLRLTLLTFQTQYNLTSRLGLLVKDGLGLSTKSHLFGIVTTLALGKIGRLAGFVLCYLVNFVFAAFATGAVGFAFFGDVDHDADVLLYTISLFSCLSIGRIGIDNHGKWSVDNENEKSMLPRWPEENLVHGERVESRE